MAAVDGEDRVGAGNRNVIDLRVGPDPTDGQVASEGSTGRIGADGELEIEVWAGPDPIDPVREIEGLGGRVGAESLTEIDAAAGTGPIENDDALDVSGGRVGVDGQVEIDGVPGPDLIDTVTEIECSSGRVGVDTNVEIEMPAGPDPTDLLGIAAKSWRDIQQTRLALTLREASPDLIAAMKTVEDRAARDLSKMLRHHPLWPWLSQYPGFGGVHVARLIAIIRDPRRFPGQRCTKGHTSLPDYAVGDQCPRSDAETEEPCPGTMLPPRTDTGTRALWHYLGLYVDANGRSPRKQKGHVADWHMEGRTAVLQPKGIADAIVLNRVPKYYDVFAAKKARLKETRAVTSDENDNGDGPRAEAVDGPLVNEPPSGRLRESTMRAVTPIEDDKGVGPQAEAADGQPEIDEITGRLRPCQIDAIARKVAAKAFVGDLLAEWKRIVGADAQPEIDLHVGLDDAEVAA